MQWYYIILLIFAGLMFLILVVAKIIRRIYPLPVPSWIPALIDNPIRRKFVQPPKEVIDRMNVEPGMTCLELGPGKGSYSIELARRAFPGTVHAVDISKRVIERLDKHIKKNGIENIKTHNYDALKLDFSDNSIDRILSITCLPEFPDPVSALREWKRVLKPDGIISLSEIFMDPDYPLRRTEKDWASKAGLKLQAEFGNWYLYQLNFTIE